MARHEAWGSEQRRSGRRHLVGPLVLLGAGIVLLLNNLQILPWSVWRDIWQYWPVLLILLGLEALATGRVAWGMLVLLVVLIPVLGIGVSAIDFASYWHEATRPSNAPLTQAFSQPLEGAATAAVEMEYGAGALDVGPLPADLRDTVLVDGLVSGHQNIRFDARATVRNDRHTIRIAPDDGDRHFDLGRFQLRLSPTVPTDLRIEAAISELNVNLESLRVPNLAIETGASQARITLPAQGQTNASIEGGAARIEVIVPPNVAARISVDGGPNRIEIDERRFPRQGDEYVSPNYATATERVNLRIAVGASRLTVQ
ncbi:MAG: hypothetical protein IT306_09055 [Chloroflexi bacterium]|nr:hypothetical protein [Chloroflexota bacterium]